ncbi:hypothetical protein MKW92_025651 [Papaver armeniacum]|nr:hypothetical protein MKW92_025651 [Papaver armeniacum]
MVERAGVLMLSRESAMCQFPDKALSVLRKVVDGGKTPQSNGSSGHCIFVFREHLRGDLQFCRQNGPHVIPLPT